MSKETEVYEFNSKSQSNAKKIVQERFETLISNCECFGDVLTIKPKRGKKQKKLLEYLGYYHIYSACEYERQKLHNVSTELNHGYSGTIDSNGNVKISAESHTEYTEEIVACDPGVYSEERYIKVCKKGTGERIKEIEHKISENDLETLLQINGESAVCGKLGFLPSTIFNLMLFLSTLSTLVYYIISSCGEFFDYFIFNSVFYLFGKNLNDSIGYSSVRFVFVVSAILFSAFADLLWKNKIRKFKNSENKFSSLIDKYIPYAHIYSALLIIFALPFDLLNVWVCSIETPGFFVQLLMLIIIAVSIIRIILTLIAIANFVISLFFLLGNVTYWRLNNSINRRKHMFASGEVSLLTRTLKEIEKSTDNSILEPYLTKDIYKI